MIKKSFILLVAFFCYELSGMDGMNSPRIVDEDGKQLPTLRKRRSQRSIVALPRIAVEGASKLLTPSDSCSQEGQGEVVLIEKKALDRISEQLRTALSRRTAEEIQRQREKQDYEDHRDCCTMVTSICCCGLGAGVLATIGIKSFSEY